MSAIETALRDLPRYGRLVKSRPYRQVWRIEIDGKPYYLKFYPRRGSKLKRMFRGNPAMREFTRLQLLQKADIPAPRAVSMLAGFRIGNEIGDAVVMQGIEPGVTLDQHFNALELTGAQEPNRREIVDQIFNIAQNLAKAKLGHGDLHLGNFLLRDGKVFLIDAYAIRISGMKVPDLLRLGHSARRYASKTELVRVWQKLGGDVPPAANNQISRRLHRKEMARITGDNAYFGKLRAGAWSGPFFKFRKFPVPWSTASRLQITEEDWRAEWPRLIQRLDSEQFQIIKDSPSGQVLRGEIILAGHPLNVIIKRPRRKYLRRYFNEIGRGSRSRRAWFKAWSLIVHDIPTAWPLLMMQRRRFGYVVDQIIVFEQIPGPSLGRIVIPELNRENRDRLFQRAGGLLRQLEQFGLYHWDAKASNFIVYDDPARGPFPILIDVDGIRKLRWTRSGIHRLLDSMRQVQKDYNPADSFALCKGYAPGARLERKT